MEFQTSKDLIDYETALATMEARVAAIQSGEQDEVIWLLEHPPLYTGGTSAKAQDLVDKRFPVYETGRGGQYTYHGPGQRIAYVMLNLKARNDKPDIRRFVQTLEQWLINTLAAFGITGGVREGRIGVWVDTPTGEKKIAALGIRVKQWVTFHGIALNVNPDLSHYSGIVPCGISQFGVTSMWDLGVQASMEDVDAVLKEEFDKLF